MFYREPVFVSQPASESSAIGETARFSVSPSVRGFTDQTPTGLTLQWQSKTPTGSWTSIGTNTTSLDEPNVTAAMSGRRYRVIATFDGQSETSEEAVLTVSGGVASAPAAPINLRATAISSSRINHGWSNIASNATGIRAERSTSGGEPWTSVAVLEATEISCSDPAVLNASTTYYYRVGAYNSANATKPSWSVIYSATTPAPAGATVPLSVLSSPGAGVSMNSWIEQNTAFQTDVTPFNRSITAGLRATVSCPAQLANGQYFQKWTMGNADVGFNTSITVQMDGSKALTAVYGASVPVPRTLSALAINGPAAVNENSSGQYSATASFSDGSSQAVAAPQWSLSSGAPASISSSGVLSAAAVAAETTISVMADYVFNGVTKSASRAVTIRKAGGPGPGPFSLLVFSNNGNVFRSPDQSSFSSGQKVVLTPVANNGYRFTGWSGDANGAASPLTVTMDGNKTITANFAPDVVVGPGHLVVTIQPPEAAAEGARWSLDGGPWQTSGTVLTPGPTGNSPVSFNDLVGWTKPAIQNIAIVPGQTTSVTGTYVHLGVTTGSLQVNLSPPDAITAGAQWRVDGGAWNNSGVTVNHGPGSATIEFKNAGIWTPPPAQTVTVITNQFAILTGSYAPPLGQPVIASISPPSGPLIGGTAVTIEGVNFAPGAAVKFGAVNATSVAVNSSSSITAFTPPNDAYVTVPVSVTVGSQTATVPNGFNYAVPRGDGIELVSQLGGANHAIKIQGNYAYVGEGNSLVVLDISNVTAPTPVGRLTLPGMVNGLAISGNYAYVADDDAGLQVVDISTPAAPAIRGYYNTGGSANKVSLLGGRAYVAAGSVGLQIINITNPLRPTRDGFYDTPNNALDIAMMTGADGVFAVIADGGNVQVINVSSPATPLLASSIGVGGCVKTVVSSGSYAIAVNSDTSTLNSIDLTNRSSPSIATTLSGTGVDGGLTIQGTRL